MTIMREQTLGLDLGGTKLLLRCEAIEETSRTGSSFTPDDLMRQVQSFIARHGLSPARIGLAVPGLVDRSGRIAACDVLPSFAGWPASAAIKDLCGGVAVLNDVKAALLEEVHDAPRDMTGGVIMIGTAVGAAFITNGKALLGASGWAGELGYLPIVVGDQVKRLDELAGGAAIAALCGLPPATLAQRARSGDSSVLQAIDAAGRSLGFGLAAVINLLNPSRLAVGGGTCDLPGYWQAARTSAEQYTIPELWRDCSLAKVRAGKQVVVLGAIRAAQA